MFKKRKSLILLILIILFILIISIFFNKYISPMLHSQKKYSSEDFGVEILISNNDEDNDGIDDFTDIMQGALSYIETKPKYKSKYYSGGYPDDEYGVCTDVIWNAFGAAGYDLKTMVDEDILANKSEYPTIETPDPNIDFRRVKNLKNFFDRNATSLSIDFTTPNNWQPGDIVVFESHIAICSDIRNKDGIPFIIHHDGLGPRERNDIENFEIVGHYRWDK